MLDLILDESNDSYRLTAIHVIACDDITLRLINSKV